MQEKVNRKMLSKEYCEENCIEVKSKHEIENLGLYLLNRLIPERYLKKSYIQTIRVKFECARSGRSKKL